MTVNQTNPRQLTRAAQPLIHCITNPISIHDCANIILAAGGRPIMAEHPAEVAEITRNSHALALNLGNITDARMKSMPESLKIAGQYSTNKRLVVDRCYPDGDAYICQNGETYRRTEVLRQDVGYVLLYTQSAR